MEQFANAFNELAAQIPNMSVRQFSDTCSLFSSLFGILDRSLDFAETDYVKKIDDLAKASRSISTLQEMVDKDIKAGRAKHIGSHTSNLLKLKRGLQFIKVLCEELLATEGNRSLKYVAIKAYNDVLKPYHDSSTRQDSATGLDSLPPWYDLLRMIGETEQSIKIHMQRYVTASARVIAYLDNLFYSKNLDIHW